jgi:5-methylcytosine-specific restriction protein A
MKLISDKEQLLSNIETVENYLAEGTDTEKASVRKLIANGRCFVAYESGKEIRFAPSRFLGYIKNTLPKHFAARNNREVDGRDTNPAISEALEQDLYQSEKLEKKYLSYCENLGIEPADHKNRKYWSLRLENDFKENNLLEGEFPEGKVVERIHKMRERNSKVVAIAKENFKRKHGKLICQVCGFDFEKVYGEIGKDFIEGHHTIPVSEMKDGHITKPEEIALLCANCHRMVHKKRPWLTMNKMNSLLKKTTKQTVHE